MAGIDSTPTPIVDLALERVQRIERALSHVVRAVELELADVALRGTDIAPGSDEAAKYLAVGATMLRISSLGINTAQNLSTSVSGENIQSITLDDVELSLARMRNGVIQEPVMTPPEVQAPVQPVREATRGTVPPQEPVATPEGSRLTRRQDVAQPDRVKHERKAPSYNYDGPLYTRIVSEKETPLMELREGMEAIPLRIITDDTIVINGEKVKLEGDQLFVFNALMKLRDNVVAAGQMRELGFRVEGVNAAQTFSTAMAKLMKRLQDATGPDYPNLIKKIGTRGATKYAVNPAIVLSDERLELRDDSSDLLEDVKKNE